MGDKLWMIGCAAGVLLIGGIAWYCRRTLYYAGLTALGRNRYATIGQVLKAPFHQPGRKRSAVAMAKQMRIVQEDPTGYTQWETCLGKFWVPSGSQFLEPIVAEMLYQHYGVGGQAVQAGDVVMDGGANVGVFVKDALLRGAATVYAFEPSRENLECLRRNFPEEIAAGRVVLVPKGLWERPTVVRFAVTPENQSANKIVGEQESIPSGAGVFEIPVTSIDAFKRETGIPRIDYIKLDIEGAERHALDGAFETLKKDKPRLAVCMYHLDDDIDVLPEKVRNANRAYRIESGLCMADGSPFRLRPHILFFL
jgi:FkbM family methyltransferase